MSRLLMAALLFAASLTACSAGADPVTIEVLASWESAGGETVAGTDEEKAFRAALTAFEKADGRTTVRYVGTRDVSQALRTRVERGSPPDIAVVPRLYDLRSYVDSGALRPLDGVPGLSGERLIRINDKPYGVSIAAHVKSLVWHGGPAAEWPELTRRATEWLDAGREPWCLGMSSPPLSGWPGTDWIEDLLLDSGTQTYDAFTAGTLEWTSAPVRKAWDDWGRLIRPGPLTYPALLTGNGDAVGGMFTGPTCLLDHSASFNAPRYNGRAVSVMASPWRSAGPATLIAEDVMGMFRDSPQARRLVRFLADANQRAGHDAWRDASAGTHLVLGGRTEGRIEDMLRGGTLCRDASDMMPPAVTEAFQHAVMRYLQDPSALDRLLADLETVRKRNETRYLKLPCFTP